MVPWELFEAAKATESLGELQRLWRSVAEPAPASAQGNTSRPKARLGRGREEGEEEKKVSGRQFCLKIYWKMQYKKQYGTLTPG